MYFSREGERYRQSEAPVPGWVFELRPPLIECNGEEEAMTREGAHFRGAGFLAEERIEELGGGLFSVERQLVNDGVGTRRFKLIMEGITGFIPEKYTIPCVSYDGNRRSGGHEPQGTAVEGRNWIFAYDRSGIPSCTVTEDAANVAAMFASDREEASLRSSCSLVETGEGRFLHRIYYPVTEAPFTYSDHDVMSERYDEYLTLRPGESFRCRFHLFFGVPEWRSFGCATLLNRVLELFPFRHEPVLTPEEVYEAALANSRFLMCDYNGHRMFRNAMRNSPEDDSIVFPDKIIEAGWSGQSFQQARHFIREFRRSGERSWLNDALSCLDGWMETQLPSGLFPVNYVRHVTKRYVPGDVCNYGWAAAEAVRSFRLLRSLGVARPGYLRFAVRLADFFVEHYDEEDGFGLKWSVDGRKCASGGTIGGFMIMALLEVYRETGAAKYLDCARRALELYVKRDLDQFVCLAGAIDCACIDKETAYPFLYCSLEMLELTGEARYLESALKAAYYFFSWAFHYDALYPPESDFSRLGYYTSGGTAVSTQHPAIDPWGVIAVPDFIRLWQLTGDERWRLRARMMWCNAILCIAPREGLQLHGHRRPFGVQSEAFFQTRWTRYRRTCEERGHLNDMYVGWPSAFRLSALERTADWNLLR